MSKRPSIPSVEQVKTAIREFNAQDWTHLNPTQVKDYVQMLDEYFIKKVGFIFRTLRISNSDKLPQKVYRVRRYDASVNTGLISEFSHPPASATKTIQRASLPYHPVFYCAPSPHTALIETLAYTYKEGEDNLYFLSEWAFRRDQPTYVTPFMFGEYNKVDLYNTLREKTFEDFKAKIPDITLEETESLKEAFGFISTLFEFEDTHAISGYLGHIHLYAADNMRTDVFIYPSAKTYKSSMNFAIHPNAVLHKLMLKRVFLVRIPHYDVKEDTGMATLQIELEDHLGINNDHGYMVWRNLTAEDFDDFKLMFPEQSKTSAT